MSMRISRLCLAAVPMAALILVGQAARLPADAPNKTGARGAGVKGGCDKASAVSKDGGNVGAKAACAKGAAVSRDGAAGFASDDRGGKAGFKAGKAKGGKGDQFAGGKGKGRGAGF